jgi:hypothetical protein
MRVVLSLVLSAAFVSGANAYSARLGTPDAARTARAALPATDADLERAEHKALLPRSDNLAGQLGIRDGMREFFNRGDTRKNGGFSVTIDGRGAKLRLRW